MFSLGVTKTNDMLGPRLLSNMNNCEGNKYVKIWSCSTLLSDLLFLCSVGCGEDMGGKRK